MESMESKIVESKEMPRPEQSINWATYTASKTREIASRIEKIKADLELGETGEYQELLELFGDAKALRSLVVERKLDVFKDGIEMILEREIGASLLLDINDIRPVVEALRMRNLPDQLIMELSDMAYHQEDERMMFHIARIIFEHSESLAPVMVERVRHNLATWESEINSDPETAIILNREVLAIERKKKGQKDSILESKAMFGLTHSKAKIGEVEPVKHTVNNQNFESKQDVMGAYLALSEIQSKEEEWEGSMMSVGKAYDMALELIDYFEEAGSQYESDARAMQITFEIIKGKLDEVSKKLDNQQKRRSKPLKPKDQASEYERVAEMFEQMEHSYDRTRALARALVLRFRLAKRQDQHPEVRDKTILWAREMADHLVATVSAEDDPIGRIVALEAAANVYDGLGKTAEMLECTNEADNLRSIHKYRGEKIWA